MKSETIKKLQELTVDLNKIIVDIEPNTPAEWEAMEKMVAAHKQLRGIDVAELFERPPRAGFTK